MLPHLQRSQPRPSHASHLVRLSLFGIMRTKCSVTTTLSRNSGTLTQVRSTSQPVPLHFGHRSLLDTSLHPGATARTICDFFSLLRMQALTSSHASTILWSLMA